jgi:MFS transporter, DHA2 family, multidrug resistance protein
MPELDNASRAINPWLIAITVMLAAFMEVLDTSVANVALPHIAGNLSSSVDETTWVLTAYLVSNAIVLPLSGVFSGLFGRKRFYMVCVVIFTLSSMLCGLAPTLGSLILFRTLQGLGGGALQPVAQAILVGSFPLNKRGMAMAVYGMGVMSAPIIGPTLGGWITDNFSWRWIFLINIPVGVISVLLTSALIFDPPYLERKRPRQGLHADYIGLGLLATGLGFLEIVLDEGQRRDWLSSDLIVTSAIIGGLALVSVTFWELRQSDPIIQLKLFHDRNFLLSTTIMFVVGFVLYASIMLLPLMLQTLLGYTALESGLVMSPGGVAIILAMPAVGFLLSRCDARWLVILGLFISAMGLFQMSHFNLDLDFHTAMMARIVQSAGLGVLFVPINTLGFAYVPKEKTDYASGIINLARNIGGSSGIAVAGTVLARRAQFHQHNLVSHLTPLDPGYNEAVQRMANMLLSKGADAVGAMQQALSVIYEMVRTQATMKAFLDSFWLLGIAFCAVIPLVFLMKSAGVHRLRQPPLREVRIKRDRGAATGAAAASQAL